MPKQQHDQRTELARKRDEALSRRLEIHCFNPTAIRLGIRELANSLDRPTVLAVQALISRVIAPPVPKFLRAPIEDVLPQEALQALVPIKAEPLFFACLAMAGSYSTKNADRIETILFHELEIDLLQNFVDIWEKIKYGQRHSWPEIAAASRLNLKGLRYHPRFNERELFDTCRLVHANPTADTVAAIAVDYFHSLDLEQYPLTKAGIVRAATWSEDPSRLLTVLSEQSDQYIGDIVEYLVNPPFPSPYEQDNRRDWQKVADPSLEGMLALTDLLIGKIDRMPDEQRTEIAKQLFGAARCPWLWMRWRELCKILPLNTTTIEWFEKWNNYGTTNHPMMQQLDYIPLEEILETVPLETQAQLSVNCIRCSNEFTHYGLPAKVLAYPDIFVPVLRPDIETGRAPVPALVAVISTLGQEEGRKLMAIWATAATEHNLHKDHLDSPGREDYKLLVETLDHLDMGAVGILQGEVALYHLIRNGYELYPEDVDAINPDNFFWIDSQREKHYSECLQWRSLSAHNVALILRHPWDRSKRCNVIRSVIAVSSYIHIPQSQNAGEEWLEQMIVPELLRSNPLMREFCIAAWTTSQGADVARTILIRGNRLQEWMDDHERTLMSAYIQFNPCQMLNQEQAILRAVLSPNEILDLLFTSSKYDGFCNLEPWLDLFDKEPARRRLVAFVKVRLREEPTMGILNWVKVAGLIHIPSIRSSVRKLLCNEKFPRLAELAALLLTF